MNSHGDHRIAMSAAILGLAGDRTSIRQSQCVSKSYPGFFEDLIAMGVKLASR
ncbi:MAG: hypothetical protein ACK54P_16785 [Bacteroidota bacterium]